METRSAKRKKLLNYNSYEVSSAEDRISDLPCEIVHHIFSFLPFKHVAQTCVLSKRWKHMWYSYPCLEFTTASDFFDERVFIDHIVRSLEKHSDVRILKFCGRGSCSGLVRLMRKTVEHNVQELDFEFSTRENFNLPRCIVNSLSLRHLRLTSRDPGNIRLPPLELMKNGFKSLRSLSLSGVNLHDQPSLLNLFTDPLFPSLTKLHLECFLGLKYLRIQMPGLRDFSLAKCLTIQELDISVEKLKKLRIVSSFASKGTRVKIYAPFLEFIIWSSNSIPEECAIRKFDSLKEAFVGTSLLNLSYGYNDPKMPSVSNFVAAISQCQRLTLERQFIELLSRLTHFSGFQQCVFHRLKSLEVRTDLRSNNTAGFSGLLRNSPNVATIVIWIESNDGLRSFQWDMDKWEREAHSFLDHLKFVKIFGFMESKNGIGLVKFLLKHGKVLQRLSLSKRVGSPPLGKTIKSKFMGFPRASSNAQISFQ